MSQAVPGKLTTIASGVEILGLGKRYGDTIALDGLNLAANAGEILGVAGPNGAGKSTMVKILAAEVEANAGQIFIDGEAWTPGIGARRIAVVHQEPQLFPNLTVAENLVIGRERTSILRRDANKAEMSLMRDLAIADVAHVSLDRVSLAVQQRTEIARALAQDARVVLFDEPNSALTEEESNDLFRRMHALAEAGRVVILVSHRLAELVAHADRVAIILDGRCAKILEGETLTQDGIARQLVTGHLSRAERTRTSVDAATEPSVDITNWTHGRREFEGIDLQVRAGEIVALVGVEGSGARELVRSLAGVEPASGRIAVSGRSGRPAIHEHTAFVTADRDASLFENLSVGDNLVARLSHQIAGATSALHRGRMREIGEKARDRYSVKARNLGQPIRSLSGGNQQKVAIAAAIVKRPRVLVLEEPTRGVDISSKGEIYRHLREYAAEGNTIILFCTEIPEAFEIADRIHVASEGKLSEPLLVVNYPHLESLAAAITALEEHARRGVAGSAGAAD